MRILGIDAALNCTGMGVVEAGGRGVRAVEYGCIRNTARRRLPERLACLRAGVSEWIGRAKPDEIAVEGVFFCRNVKTALSLGHARGAVLAACGDAGVPVHEYSPRRIKQAVCGFGGAGKEQVTRMIAQLLELREKPPPDAADALAIALCHWHAGRGIAAQESRL